MILLKGKKLEAHMSWVASHTSEARRKAAQQNGAKGGRPRNPDRPAKAKETALADK